VQSTPLQTKTDVHHEINHSARVSWWNVAFVLFL